MNNASGTLSDLNDRSRAVFRTLVESYLDTGGPVGSRTLARDLEESVSPATVRNVMQDLEFLGLLHAPHVSAGRIPTQMGLRLFVDGLLQFGDVSTDERTKIEASIVEEQQDDIAGVLDRAGAMLSGLTQGASLVLSPASPQIAALSCSSKLMAAWRTDFSIPPLASHPPQCVKPRISSMRS